MCSSPFAARKCKVLPSAYFDLVHGTLWTTSHKDAEKFAFLSAILGSVQSLRTGIISSPVSLGASVNRGVFTASFSNRRLQLSLNNVFSCGFYFQSAVVRKFSQRLQFAFVLQHFTPCFWKTRVDFSVRRLMEYERLCQA